MNLVKIKLLYFFILLLFFIFFHQTSAVSNTVVINEIMIGQTGNSKNEFIELYNNSDQAINLTGYSLKKKTASGNESNLVSASKFTGSIPASGYFLISHPNYQINADLVYSGSSTNYAIADNNSVLLYNQNEVLVDKVGYGEAGDFEGQPAFALENNKSIERQLIGHDSDNNNADFILQNTPNPQNSQSNNNQGGNQHEETATSTPIAIATSTSYSLGDIVINEFVSDPSDGEVEWIELYNNRDQIINLTGWNIEEGSGAKTQLEGNIGASGENRFFIIKQPKGNLNNKGDIIILKDNTGKLIDQVVYGIWDDGNIDNNAPVTDDPYSIARKFDGYNTYNNNNDFDITTTPTKAGSNVITKIVNEDESNQDNKIYDYSDCVIISEILPNPKGSDSENEFIELYNNCEQDVDLIKWKLEDESGKKYEFKINNKIKASEYLAVYRKESKIALNNNGDSIKLYQPLKEEALQIVKYQKAIEGWSYVDTQILVPGKDPGAVNKIATNESWVWSEIVTPGKINIIKTINHPPIIDFYSPDIILIGTPVIFDSSDTIDEDDDDLKFQWDFGDGIKLNLPSPEHTYLKSGIYAIKLIVSDNENAIEKEKIVSVQDDCCALPKPYGCLDVNVKENCNLIANIIINEILPNPEGPDAEEEWIELKNIGDAKVNLLNWKLNDAVVDGKGYKFNSDAWIDSDDFFVVYRPDSKITLNNNFDTIKLFNNFDALVDEVEYQKAPIGESYAKNQNKKWFWTTILTPGKENIFSEQFSDATISKTLQKSSKSKNYIVETTLEKIREFESGDLIKVKGVVAVKPNVFSSQYFYIVGSQGIQVYSYKKDFPDLRVGDYVEINGELSTIIGEQRLKTKSSDSIKILEHRQEPIAEEVSSDKINEDYVGRLVAVSGEAVEQKGSTIYLDDGMDEVQIYVKKLTDINPKSIKVGDQVKITGIVSKTNSGVKIMPRSSDDIVKINIFADSNADEILGSIAVNDEWEIAQRNKKMELFKYLLVFACGIIIILIGMLIKLKKEL